MKKNEGLWQLVGAAFTALAGTLLHFLYDWTGRAAWSAWFSGVNESTWEHMKLFFVPAFAFAGFQSLFFRDCRQFWCSKLESIALGLGAIPVLFYTYNGAIGPSPTWFNVSLFFLAVGLSFFWEGRRLEKKPSACDRPGLALGCLCLLAVLFVLFSFYPPRLGLFLDPVTQSYGR